MLKRGRLFLGANQVNPEPLERLQDLLGGSIYKRNRVMGKNGKQSPNKRAWYGWEMRDQNDILLLMDQIRPWLSANRLSRIPWESPDVISGVSS